MTAFLVANDVAPPTIAPDFSTAVRNDRYKIVQNTTMQYQSQDAPCVQTVETEFYAINEAVPLPLLDDPERELSLAALTPEQQAIYDALLAQMNATLDSAPSCPGDGNIDSVVNQQDLDQWSVYSQNGGLSTVYDFNLDGHTDAADQSVIMENVGLECGAS